MQTPDRTTLSIAATPTYGDPLRENLKTGAHLGFLGIEYHSRRRNRLTGRVSQSDETGIEVTVDQTFGNCPKFIQAREITGNLRTTGGALPITEMTSLDDRARTIVGAADHFFIATHYAEDADDKTQGADVSHRGGKPGFVRVDDDSTLTFPDFTGNHHFNTLGNIQRNPRAGLLFVDFETGDLLYLTCSARIIWEGDELSAFTGAERLVEFKIDRGRLVEGALPLHFSFVEYSPFLEQTGSWEEVAEKQRAREEGNRYRELTVSRVEPESATVTSFYLEPTDGRDISCHRAGQFLPIEVVPPGAEEAVGRTYTISNAPNGKYYRLSIKREVPADGPPGVVSNFFHDHVRAGTKLRALPPRGAFALDTTHERPVVLLSAGVGVTPMVSMLEKLNQDRTTCGCKRRIWFIHGARNASEMAFGRSVRDLEAQWPELTTHFRFSQPTSDVAQFRHDSVGHVDVALIKSLLPFDDYDFYVCGPGAFMESIYGCLKELNVSDSRIHYEYFGPGKALATERPHKLNVLADRPPVAVKFSRSNIDATWRPESGSLLDLAESAGLAPPYSCRSGVCQTCAVRVEAGSVDYVDPPAAPPPDGTALICCAHPIASADSENAIVLDL